MDDNASLDSGKIAAIEKYLSRGWALVPLHWRVIEGLCSCGNHGCRSVGKHPMFKDWPVTVASTAEPWQRNPDWNVGIATGAPSGFWVLDYDPANAGTEAETLVTDLITHDALRPHARTGGGGLHWRFDMPPDFEVTNRRGTLPAGLDVRGTGGQVVAPPSVSGKGPYVELPTSAGTATYEAPGWLLDMIRPAVPTTGIPPAGWSPLIVPDSGQQSGSGDRGQRYAAAAVAAMLADLSGAFTNRNDLAWRVACRILEFVNAGWLDERSANMAWERTTLAHPLGIVVPESEINSIWTSADRHVGDRPAELPPEWTDPLRVEVWPNVRAVGVAPFSPGSNGAASTYALPTMVEPGSTMVNGARPAVSGIVDGQPPAGIASPDPQTVWDAAVEREATKILLREAAQRRAREIEAGNRASVAARLRAELIDSTALLARPRPVPVVEGLLFRNTLARIVGKPGAGKTHVTLDLAAHVAAGMAWAGRPTCAVRGAYVVAEGDGGFGGRVEAWQAHHGRAVELVYLPRAVQIGGPEWDAWCDVMREGGYGLVVVDTQARATVGRDEIDGRDSGEVVAALDRLRVATGALVLLVHHTNMSGGTTGRGHGGILGALDVELYVSATTDGRVITVKGGKSKDTAKPEDMLFDLVDVPAPVVPDASGFVEPTGPGGVPAAVLGVVPVWRGAGEVATGALESIGTTRARQLWQVIHDRYNPGMGGTQAEIKAAWADVAWSHGPTSGRGANGFRKGWARAWADLIQRGLLAKSFGASRFKVVVLADQSADGVLTPNRTGDSLISEGPTGFEVVLTDVTESEGHV